MNDKCDKHLKNNNLAKPAASEAPDAYQRRRGQFQARIVLQQDIAQDHKSLLLRLLEPGAAAFAAARAGQFVQVACRNLNDPTPATPTLRRPLSIASVASEHPHPVENQANTDQKSTYVELIYRICGPGTRYLAQRIPGDPVDLLGPLGNGFALPDQARPRAILVGGGVGLPPLFFLAQQLMQQPSAQPAVMAIAAGRTQTSLVARLDLQEYQADKLLTPQPVVTEFSHWGVDALLATDDGTCGYHGTAAGAFEQFVEKNPTWCDATVYACGPDPMLRAVALACQRLNMPCQVCMEAYMACGIGVCQSCAVPIRSQSIHPETGGKWHYRLVCTHGPVFDAETVLWDHPGPEKD